MPVVYDWKEVREGWRTGREEKGGRKRERGIKREGGREGDRKGGKEILTVCYTTNPRCCIYNNNSAYNVSKQVSRE